MLVFLRQKLCFQFKAFNFAPFPNPKLTREEQTSQVTYPTSMPSSPWAKRRTSRRFHIESMTLTGSSRNQAVIAMANHHLVLVNSIKSGWFSIAISGGKLHLPFWCCFVAFKLMIFFWTTFISENHMISYVTQPSQVLQLPPKAPRSRWWRRFTAPLHFPGHAAHHLRLLLWREGTTVVPQARVQGQQVEEQGQGSSAFGVGGMVGWSWGWVGFLLGGWWLVFFRIADGCVCYKGVVILNPK